MMEGAENNYRLNDEFPVLWEAPESQDDALNFVVAGKETVPPMAMKGPPH